MTTNYAGQKKVCSSNQGFSVVHTSCPQQSEIPWHSHDEAFLTFLLSGSYEESGDEGAHTCLPLTTVFHPPRDSHAVRHGDHHTTALQLEISDSIFDTLHSEVELPKQRTIIRGAGMISAMSLLYKEVQFKDQFSAVSLHQLALEVMAQFNNPYSRSFDDRPNWLKDILDFIHDLDCNPTNVGSLAKEVNLHPSYLSTAFRRHTGTTIGEYLRRLRVANACTLMTRSTSSLATISSQAGFSDQAHMTRSFQRVLGCTPRAYRSAKH